MLKRLLIASILLTACINSNAAEAERIFLDAEIEITTEGLHPKEKMVYDQTTKQYLIYKHIYHPRWKKRTWINLGKKLSPKPCIIYDASGKIPLIWNDEIKNFVPLN